MLWLPRGLVGRSPARHIGARRGKAQPRVREWRPRPGRPSVAAGQPRSACRSRNRVATARPAPNRAARSRPAADRRPAAAVGGQGQQRRVEGAGPVRVGVQGGVARSLRHAAAGRADHCGAGGHRLQHSQAGRILPPGGHHHHGGPAHGRRDISHEALRPGISTPATEACRRMPRRKGVSADCRGRVRRPSIRAPQPGRCGSTSPQAATKASAPASAEAAGEQEAGSRGPPAAGEGRCRRAGQRAGGPGRAAPSSRRQRSHSDGVTTSAMRASSRARVPGRARAAHRLWVAAIATARRACREAGRAGPAPRRAGHAPRSAPGGVCAARGRRPRRSAGSGRSPGPAAPPGSAHREAGVAVGAPTTTPSAPARTRPWYAAGPRAGRLGRKALVRRKDDGDGQRQGHQASNAVRRWPGATPALPPPPRHTRRTPAGGRALRRSRRGCRPRWAAGRPAAA